MLAAMKLEGPIADRWDEKERENRQQILRMLEAAHPAGEEVIRGLRKAIDRDYAARGQQTEESEDTREDPTHAAR
jgi:hypothetical protein